jgi:hypothetical protein
MLTSVKRMTALAAIMAAAALGGSALANAASSSPSTAAQSGSATQHARGQFPAHGTAAHEALEKPVTGANATKARAAAVKAVSGTAGAVTTDASGRGYEVQVKKADGSTVEVHLDGSFGINNHSHR